MADASGAEAATARRPGGGPAAARRKGPKGAGGGLAPGLARKVRKALELRADDPALLDALQALGAAWAADSESKEKRWARQREATRGLAGVTRREGSVWGCWRASSTRCSTQTRHRRLAGWHSKTPKFWGSCKMAGLRLVRTHTHTHKVGLTGLVRC